MQEGTNGDGGPLLTRNGEISRLEAELSKLVEARRLTVQARGTLLRGGRKLANVGQMASGAHVNTALDEIDLVLGRTDEALSIIRRELKSRGGTDRC